MHSQKVGILAGVELFIYLLLLFYFISGNLYIFFIIPFTAFLADCMGMP
jgi:hypothetical protein